jgi:ADP-dependent phosphofructokinase/glucokinase
MAVDAARLEADLALLADRPLFVAYNANVDDVVRVDAALAAALDEPVPGGPPATGPLDSTAALAAALTETMRAGEGNQRTVTPALADELAATLTPDRRSLGGQAGIMADLLSVLGAAPVFYTYLPSTTQTALFQRPSRIRFPRVVDGNVEFVPLDDVPPTARTKHNWIFEFTAGTELFGVTATGDTRLIAASRPPEFDLRMGDLDDHAEELGAAVDGCLLAGYHNLGPERRGDYDATHRHARDVLDRLAGDGERPVHVEYVVSHDADLRASIAEHVLPGATSVGLDPRELRLLAADLGVDCDPPDDPAGAIHEYHRTLATVRERLGVPHLRLHALDYHLVVGDGSLAAEAVRRGLEFAAVVAATKAATGSVTGPGDLRVGLEYDPSPAGRDAVAALAASLDEPVADDALATSSVVACPNRVVREPVGTVGIGDVVSAASVALAMAADAET